MWQYTVSPANVFRICASTLHRDALEIVHVAINYRDVCRPANANAVFSFFYQRAAVNPVSVDDEMVCIDTQVYKLVVNSGSLSTRDLKSGTEPIVVCYAGFWNTDCWSAIGRHDGSHHVS